VRRPLRSLSLFVAVCAASAIATAGTATAATNQAHTMSAHGLGAKVPALRVAVHRGVSALDVPTPPASVDLRQWAAPPGDQGAVSSCVTWAIDYGMLGWYSRYTGRGAELFAPMYTYSQIHVGGDGGSYPTAALDVAQAQGNDTRAHYTQGDYDWQTKPSASERANAAHYKIKGYSTLFAGSN
jgi:hypothetical protein